MRNKTRWILLVVSVFATGTAVFFFARKTVSAPVVDPAFSVPDLAKKIRASRLSLPPCQATVELKKTILSDMPKIPGEEFTPETGDEDGTADWRYKAGKVYLKLTQKPDHRQRQRAKYVYTHQYIQAFDGKKVRAWQVRANQDNSIYRIEGIDVQPALAMHNNILTPSEEFDPRYYAYTTGKETLDAVVADEKNSLRYVQTETVFGSHCAKLEGHRSDVTVDLWIDLDHNFMLRKYEVALAFRNSQKTMVAIEIPDITGKSPYWLPATIRKRSYWPSRQANDIVPSDEEQITVSNVQINADIPDAVFDPPFPKGTVVHIGPLPARK